MANCIARISCGNCRHSWDVHWRDIGQENANVCPYCGEKIDRDLWDAEIIPAAGHALDCNRELQQYAEGYRKTRFAVAFLFRKDKR